MTKRDKKFADLSRQLSVLLTLFVSLPAVAQTMSSTRTSIQNDAVAATAAVPSYDSKMTLIYLNKVTALKTGMDDLKFRSFYVKPDLTMGIEYHYDFVFNFTAATSQGEARTVPDGYYQITVASFLKDAGDIDRPDRIPKDETLAQRFVTRSKPMYVRIAGGEGLAEVSLRFDNPTQASVDSTLYIEFVPLQAECTRNGRTYPCLSIDVNGEVDTTRSDLSAMPGYYPYLMNMDFLPYEKANAGRKAGNRRSRFTDEIMKTSLAQFTTKVIAQRQRTLKRYRRRVITPQRYADLHEMNFVSLTDPAFSNGRSKWLKGATATDVIRQVLDADGGGAIRSETLTKSLRKIFCSYMAERLSTTGINGRAIPGLPTGMCGTGGELNFAFRRSLHVGEVAGNYVKRRASAIEKMVLMNNFAVTRAHDEGASRTHAVKPWSTLVKAVDPLGFIPYDYTQSVSIGNSRGMNQGGIQSRQTYIDLFPVVLSIPTTNTQACLEVVVSAKYSSSQLIDTRPGARNNFYVCEDDKSDRTVQEIYLHAFTRMTDTAGADSHDRLTQTMNLSLRGDRDVTAFDRITRKDLTAERDERPPSWYSEEAQKYFDNTPPGEAGVIATPVFGANDQIPSYLEMALSPVYQEKFNVGNR